LPITIAENAGFCFGVKRATDFIEKLLDTAADTRVYTLGQLIHHPDYIRRLEARGVRAVDFAEACRIAEAAPDGYRHVLVVRTHGVVAEQEAVLRAYEQTNPHFSVVDMTCPFVKRIHQIAQKNTHEGTLFVMLGKADHPEVRGVLSYAAGERAAISDCEALLAYLKEKMPTDKQLVLVAQTTQNTAEWEKSEKNIKKLYTNSIFFDTICDVTEKRQAEVKALARNSDVMVIIGGKNSANTRELYEIGRSLCERTLWIETARELPPIPSVERISIAAGASTPGDIIMEVYRKMSFQEQTMSFEEMIDGALKTLHTGEIVTGIVTEITDTGIYLDIGTKVTGYIAAAEVSDDPSVKLREVFHYGDAVQAKVLRVNDGEGMANLSKKAVDQDKDWLTFIDYYEKGTILEGTVTQTVKGGVLMNIANRSVFVPASHTDLPKEADLSTLLGTTQRVKLIDLDKQRRRALASIRLVKKEDRKAELEQIWSRLELGQQFTGTVKNLTSYGAFVDIGGVDGMVHNSELSWKRIKHPSQVVKVGEEIQVYIKELDRERKRISLGYKTEEMDTWSAFVKEYHAGDVLEGKITGIMPFGAFAEVYDGVEGLIHISRISLDKIAKPEDALSLGQTVTVKITEIDLENRKLSLSIRALLEEQARAEAEAQRKAEKEERMKAYEEERAKLEQERAEMAPYIVGSID